MAAELPRLHGELARMTQFKEKTRARARRASASAVRLSGADGGGYPALSDETGAVGADQKQHLELTRDIASA